MCMLAYAYISISAYSHVRMQAYVHAGICACLHMCIFLGKSNSHFLNFTRSLIWQHFKRLNIFPSFIYMHMSICACLHTRIFAYVHACIRIYAHMYMPAYVHTSIYACLHAVFNPIKKSSVLFRNQGLSFTFSICINPWLCRTAFFHLLSHEPKNTHQS